MDEFMIFRKVAIARLVLSLLAIVGMSDVVAEGFKDPTKPPVSISSDGSRSNGTTETVSATPVLQSVLVSPGRTIAIISGQTVSVGEQVGEARVVRIAATEVVLRHGKDLQTLKLFPDVEKRAPGSRVASKAIVPTAQ